MTADAVDLTYDQTHRLHPGKTYPPPPDDATCLHGARRAHLLPDKLDLAAPDAENDGNGQDADESTAPAAKPSSSPSASAKCSASTAARPRR